MPARRTATIDQHQIAADTIRSPNPEIGKRYATFYLIRIARHHATEAQASHARASTLIKAFKKSLASSESNGQAMRQNASRGVT
jgi:hypothetical protein